MIWILLLIYCLRFELAEATSSAVMNIYFRQWRELVCNWQQVSYWFRFINAKVEKCEICRNSCSENFSPQVRLLHFLYLVGWYRLRALYSEWLTAEFPVFVWLYW